MTAQPLSPIIEAPYLSLPQPRSWFWSIDDTLTPEETRKLSALPLTELLAKKELNLQERQGNLEEFLDLSSLTGLPVELRRQIVLFTSVTAPEAGELVVTAGADFFFELSSNGKTVFSLLQNGNGGTPVSSSDHIFKLPLQEGENTLAFLVQSGSCGWGCALSFPAPERKVLCRFSQMGILREMFPDFRELTYGPWLTHVTPDQAYIHFNTNGVCGSAVEYRIRGEQEWHRRYQAQNHYLLFHVMRHEILLKELRPHTCYEFRILLFEENETFSGDTTWIPKKISILPDIYSFRTLPASDAPYPETRFFAFSDTHLPRASRLKALELYQQRYHFTDGDFMVHLGDVTSTVSNFDDEILGGFVEFFNQQGKLTPLCMVHGNHEYSGREADLWNRAFASPSGRSYYAFTSGPAFFLVLDYLVAPEKEALNDGEHIREESRWIRDVLESEACRRAVFRIVLNHIVPMKEFPANRVCARLLPLLEGTQWHLFLAGHNHHYLRGEVEGIPCLIVAGGESARELCLTEFEISPEEMRIRSFRPDRILDDFRIDSAGNVLAEEN